MHVDRKGEVSIGPQRVLPLSSISAQHPHLLQELAEIKEFDYTLFDTSPVMALLYIREPDNSELTSSEKQILSLIREIPHTLHHVSKEMGRDYDLLPWQGPVSYTHLDVYKRQG